MRKHLFGATLLACAVLMAGTAAAQTIDDIQYYDPVTGDPASPYDGQVVTVYGKIYVVKGTYNNGTHYILGDTGGINFYGPSAPAVTYGDSIEVTGTVADFGGEINLSSPTVVFIDASTEPTPVVTDVGELVNPYDYERVGDFVSVHGFVTDKGSNNFYLHNAMLDTIQVYIDSDTGIDISGVSNGDEYTVFSPVVTYYGEIELKPRKQSDLRSGKPIIEDIECDNWAPEASDPVEVQCTILDVAKSIVSANLFYRDDPGDSSGTWVSIPMSSGGGDTYSATIPAPHALHQVDFYIQATDDAAQTSTNPGGAPNAWYELAIGTTSIYEMQWADPNVTYQGSPYRDRVLNIEGVVIAGTGQVGAPSKFVLQEADPYDPDTHGAGVGEEGTYKWGGVLVYEGTAANFVLRGDLVRVGGYGDEYYGLTEMVPHTPSSVYLLAFGQDLPEPMRDSTRILGDNTLDDGNGNLGEAYESTWVKTWWTAVVDTSQYDWWLVSDTTAREDSLEIDPYITLTYDPDIGDVRAYEGFMDFFYDRQLIPLGDEFIYSGPTAVDDDLPLVQSAGGFTKVAPNPFNPKTEIRFVLTRPNLAQLNIYNIRGELVRSLVNERMTAMEHTVEWDGTDATGQTVSSGTYFARLRIGLDLMQVFKLSLIK